MNETITPTADNRQAIEIPLRMQPGQIWFYLELALIEDVPALYKLLAELGIKPRLAYMETRQGVEIMLLLAHEQRVVMEESPDDYYWEEQLALSNAINTEAIHCAFRRTSSLVVAA